MIQIKSGEWTPVDGLRLEDAALRVVTSNSNVSVIAGPGAGKTELLAQRASYLLQTGICYPPKKILAISFKKDAADNLQKRVTLRCGSVLASRFESLTFDAFAKRLVDHFRRTVPIPYRPIADYDIWSPNKKNLNDIFSDLNPPSIYRRQLALINRYDFLKEYSLPKLPFTEQESESVEQWALRNLWIYMINKKKQLSFPMISRIAEFMLRENEPIILGLQATYSHVFLDEFQDTTLPQYDLLKTCFRTSKTVLTAVGDSKQRIMGWAGALVDAFHEFEVDFNANRETLLMNFRSAPRLVEMQRILAKSLSDSTVVPQPSDKWGKQDGTCQIWTYDGNSFEAKMISKQIEDWIRNENLNPRDICVLVKQKPADYCNALIEELSLLGIKSRIESELQDLLSEPVSKLILDYFAIVVKKSAPDSWVNIVDMINKIYVTDSEEQSSYEIVLRSYVQQDKESLLNLADSDQEKFEKLVRNIFVFFKVDYFRSIFSQYRKGNYFDDLVIRITKLLWNTQQECHDWVKTLDTICGINTIPIMTIHKSKGLEYDTVIFIGLEDQAFWSFTGQEKEDTAAFFVAFSRAKRRVIFTFSNSRKSIQSRERIKSLYDLLIEAGVKEQHFSN